ncbi:unnamed protein product [marine sediment metagenome]|uniref:Uncharacterized protein n=1 Tax=marine sediment metagenome TaxID=412755 RepID=X1AIL0_9ZZZZ
MKRVIALLLIAPFLIPVTANAFLWDSKTYQGGETPNAVCRHETLFCAFVLNDRYNVRVAYGWPSGVLKEGEAHVQAQALVKDKWLWLVMKGRECNFGNQDFFDPPLGNSKPFLVSRLLTLNEYVQAMHKWAIEERLLWESFQLYKKQQLEKGK